MFWRGGDGTGQRVNPENKVLAPSANQNFVWLHAVQLIVLSLGGPEELRWDLDDWIRPLLLNTDR